MGARSEVLAKQFEAKAQEAAAVLETLSDADEHFGSIRKTVGN